MPGVNETQAAVRMDTNVIRPLIEQLRARGTLVRLAFCMIGATVESGKALVTFETGGTTFLPHGMTVPSVGERWRCLDYGGGLVLDDLAIA